MFCLFLQYHYRFFFRRFFTLFFFCFVLFRSYLLLVHIRTGFSKQNELKNSFQAAGLFSFISIYCGNSDDLYCTKNAVAIKKINPFAIKQAYKFHSTKEPALDLSNSFNFEAHKQSSTTTEFNSLRMKLKTFFLFR